MSQVSNSLLVRGTWCETQPIRTSKQLPAVAANRTQPVERTLIRGAGWLLAALVLTAPSAAWSQGVEYVKEHYTKHEYYVPMRDGVKLFTAVYVPKDKSQSYPFMMVRSPYSAKPYGADQYRPNVGNSVQMGKAGYIFVYQDVRGRWMSEGEFVNMRPHLPQKNGNRDIDESSDTYDTIEWLLKNIPNHNGKVGLTGVSYPGFYTAAGMIDAHPALAACSPQAPITDWFMGDDWHHNGALLLPHAFNFMGSFGRARPEPTKKFEFSFDHGTPDGYDFFLRLGPLRNADLKYFKGDVLFWNEVMRHENYDDFWKRHNLRPHLKNIRPAVLTVGGWFDAENLFGALEVYKNVEASSKNANMLVMGPWYHGGWLRSDGAFLGDVHFNAKTSEFYREKIELPFFEHYLKGKGTLSHPEAWVFETGTNQWREYEAWPPRAARSKTFYFRAGGQLADAPPSDTNAQTARDEYVSDPAKPVPYIEQTSINMVREYMVADQRFASRRPDVLVYQSEVLDQDVAFVGPIEAELFVSTSGTDSDWIVKVIDVYPNDFPDPAENPRGVKMGGYQQLVRGDVFRGKFRQSFENPTPFAPDRPEAVKFTLPDVCHTFRRGHRIMVQVQSSWFPLIDRNPQKFVDINSAEEADFQKATQRVYRTAELASRIVVKVQEPERPAGK